MANLYEILFRFRPDGTLRGSHVVDWADDGKRAGDARRMTQADIDAIGGILDYAHTQRIAELTQEIAEMKASHAAEIEAMQAVRAASADGDLAARLAEIHRALPMEVQVAFSAEVVTIMGLLDLGRADLARARLEATAVPDALAETKAAMVAAISQ